jgi:hypothetical protein
MKAIRVAPVIMAFVSASTIELRPASAEIYRPWCIGYTATISNSCTFVSFEQCMMTARGSGGSCMQNPWYLQYGERGLRFEAKSERNKLR